MQNSLLYARKGFIFYHRASVQATSSVSHRLLATKSASSLIQRRHQPSEIHPRNFFISLPTQAGIAANSSPPLSPTSLQFLGRRFVILYPAKSILRDIPIKSLWAWGPLAHYSDLPWEGAGEPRRVLFEIWTLLLATCIVSGALLTYVPPREKARIPSGDLTGSGKLEQRTVLTAARGSLRMTGKSLPGRPGNLTVEQEEKLREAWIATLQVFGVLDSARSKEPDSSGNGGLIGGPRQKPGATSPEKPKKKRISLFGKKHKDTDTKSTAPTDSILVGAPVETDDKYGQTKQFHDTLARQTPESLRAAFWSMVKHDHPDALLLRFLRARKWDVEKALVMMVSTMNWRVTEMHVDDDIMRLGEEDSLIASQSSNPDVKKSGEDFLAQMRMGKSFLHGADKLGRPMCFVRVRLHKQGEQNEESLERYTVFVIESARMLLAPPVDTACVVFDMTGFSMANMDYSPVRFMIKCFEANYPESLGVVLVHKAPWVFQGIWKIIRGWLDPVVASKVHFTNNVEEMEEFVPRGHIPKDLGGDEDWSYQYIEPDANENSKMKDTKTRDKLQAEREQIVNDFEKATIDWIDHSMDDEVWRIKERRDNIASDLRKDYWSLDPYIRARSLYDRFGTIQPGGRIDFYPKTVLSRLTDTNGAHEVKTSVNDLD